MRAILRALLISVFVIIVAFVAFAYLSGSVSWGHAPSGRAVGTTGTVDAAKARERGAELGEKAADAANKVGETVSEAAITAKIKAKMTLDDSVKARAIDVTTRGTVVTLEGTVATSAEHDRAVALARETAGVTRVVDRLQVVPAGR